MKRLYCTGIFILLLFGMLMLQAVVSQEAYAWVNVREDVHGYFDNNWLVSNFYYCDDVNRPPCRDTGGSILPEVYDRNTEAIPSRVNDAEKLYKFLRDEVYYNDSLDQHEVQKSMVAFLVNSMMGVHPDKASRVLTEKDWQEFYARLTLPGVRVTREDYSSTRNVYHQGTAKSGAVRSRESAHDAAWLEDDGMGGSAIVISYYGKVVYAMHTVCANPDGSLPTGLPELPEPPADEPPVVACKEIELSPAIPDHNRPVKVRGGFTTSGGKGDQVPAKVTLSIPEKNIKKHVMFSGSVERDGHDGLYEYLLAHEVGVGDKISVIVNVEVGDISLECPPEIVTVPSKPYFKVYGGDVAAGVAFGADGSVTPCAPNNSSFIRGWLRKADDGSGAYVGSGAQLAVFAVGAIEGFATGQLLDSKRPTKLTFANVGVGEFGGSWGTGSAPCAADFWQLGGNEIDSSTFQVTKDDRGTFYSDDDLLLGDAASEDDNVIGDNNHVTIFVKGDVHINKNVVYEKLLETFTDISEIPSFRLIVQGNIYVSPEVHILNGLYVAMPRADDPGKGGKFYTCSDSFGPPSSAQLQSGDCSTSLTIFGAVIADTIKLARTHGDLSDASAEDRWDDSGAPAESFIYSPFIWLTSDFSLGRQLDAIRTLPPAL